MKKMLLAIGFVAALMPCAAQASVTYLINPAASYVDALVPVWTSEPSLLADPSQPPTFDWTLNWASQRFSLSGSFTLNEEASPFVPAVSHLNLSNISLLTNAPAYTSVSLPSFVTRTGTAVERSEGVCWSDPFFGVPFSCGGLILGPWFEYQGNFDGTTLDLVGNKIYGVPFSPYYFGLSEQPQLSDADLAAFGGGLSSFSLRATAVPEPVPLALLAIGIVGISALRRRGQRNSD